MRSVVSYPVDKLFLTSVKISNKRQELECQWKCEAMDCDYSISVQHCQHSPVLELGSW